MIQWIYSLHGWQQWALMALYPALIIMFGWLFYYLVSREFRYEARHRWYRGGRHRDH